jgi:hypothetical protein
MMKLRALFLILIYSAVVFEAASAAGLCRRAVSRLDFSSVDTSEFAKRPSDHSTVKHLQSSKEDPDFAILKLTGSQWRSNWSPDGQNLQSDPRNLLILLGDNVAQKLGFSWIDKNTLKVPKGKYFSTRLLKLNEHLRRINSEPLDISFYDTNAHDPLLALEFLSKALSNRLPVAQAGHFLIHDVAAHYGSILLPKAITRELTMKIQVAQKFIKEMEPVLDRLSPEMASQIRDINQRWLQVVAGRVDAVTGNFTFRYVDTVLMKGTHQEKADFLEIHYLKTVRSETSEKLMKDWISFLFMNIESFRFELQNFEQQFEIIYSFTNSYLKNLPQGAREPLRLSAAELLAFVEKRRLDISLWDGN